MDARHTEILDSLPPKEPRSRLEPYRELIREMRRRGRTYREVVQVLGERCGVRVAPSTVHEFVSRRARAKPSAIAAVPEAAAAAPGTAVRLPVPIPATDDADAVKRRIEALKRSSAPAKAGTKLVFRYDEREPLRVRPVEPEKEKEA